MDIHGLGHGSSVQNWFLGKYGHHTFGKTDDVQGHAKGLRQIQGNADSSAYLYAKGAADHKVCPACLYRCISGYTGYGQGCEKGNGGGKGNDDERTVKPYITHHPSEAEVHNNPEDSEQGGGKYPAESA